MARKEISDATKRRGQALVKRIRDTRNSKGMSQEALARLVNVSTETIRAIEQEKTLVPGVFLAADLVKELDGNLSEWIATTGKTSKPKGRN